MKKIVLVALMALCSASFANVDQDIMNKETEYNYYLMEKATECMLDKCNGNSQCNYKTLFSIAMRR